MIPKSDQVPKKTDGLVNYSKCTKKTKDCFKLPKNKSCGHCKLPHGHAGKGVCKGNRKRPLPKCPKVEKKHECFFDNFSKIETDLSNIYTSEFDTVKTARAPPKALRVNEVRFGSKVVTESPNKITKLTLPKSRIPLKKNEFKSDISSTTTPKTIRMDRDSLQIDDDPKQPKLKFAFWSKKSKSVTLDMSEKVVVKMVPKLKSQPLTLKIPPSMKLPMRKLKPPPQPMTLKPGYWTKSNNSVFMPNVVNEPRQKAYIKVEEQINEKPMELKRDFWNKSKFTGISQDDVVY